MRIMFESRWDGLEACGVTYSGKIRTCTDTKIDVYGSKDELEIK